jgi:hypothetical protein
MADRSYGPAPIRITDLAEPGFSEDAHRRIAAISALADGLTLEPDAICAQASLETGLSDFGGESFRARLALLTRAFREEGDLSPMGLVSVHAMLVNWMKNRLLLEELLRRHPEISQVRVERPIVIVGMPRSGTTHLHNLMSVDPAIRTLPYWEALEPLLPDSERPLAGAPDPRRERCMKALAETQQLIPHFRAMHDVDADGVEEEFMLLLMDLATNVIETLSLMPSYRDWYRRTDQTAHYLYLKRALGALQWVRGGRWLLKCQQHLEQMQPAINVFPDATFIFTHRDPVAVIASAVTMIAYRARLFDRRVDPVRIGAYWVSRFEDLLRGVVRDHSLAPPSRTLHVHFKAFMDDEIGTVESIYACARQPFTPSVADGMRQYLDSHARGRFGRIVYDLSDFDLDEAELRDRFRFYTDHFGVDREIVASTRG